ncbi:MAG: hypothetical protein GYB25_02595 [Rhodobacteraceae bacterium]|nr:hypothetical protein [Paracoccaceae bacterium]
MSAPKSGASLPVARQLRRAIETAAEARMGLSVEVRAVHQSLRPLEEVRGLLDGSGFLALLEGRPGGGIGLDMAVLSGIVEHQTIGSILSRSEVPRRPTRVDAALLAPLLDDCLTRFSGALEADGGGPWGRGYAFGAMVGTARGLVLTLSEGLYHVFEMELALMGGAREGRMVVAFPDKVEAALPDTSADADPLPPGESLRAGVMTAQATLDAVLARVSMPLAQFQALAVGEVVVLPPGALQDAQLEINAEAGGLPVSLGQLNGFRAVRLKVGQERRREADKAGAPSLREALAEEPDISEADQASMPLNTVEVLEELPEMEVAESAEMPVLEEGLDDLDDLLGGLDEDVGGAVALPA